MLEPAPIVELKDDPTPEGLQAFWFDASDGIRLRAAISPARGKPQGSVFFSSGRSEYIEKYFELIREMNERGLTVAIIDHRGQGLSDRLLANPLLGHVGNFSDYAKDMETLWGLIENQMPEPRFLVAHSMGGAIAADLARRGNIQFSKMLACAPMLGFAGDSPVLKFAVWALSKLWLKKKTPTRATSSSALDPKNAEVLTSNKTRFGYHMQRITLEPKLQLAGPTFGWLQAAINLYKSLAGPTGYEKITIPVYYAIAGKEALVSNRAISQACQILPNAKCTVFEGALHEIFQERDEHRNRFMQDLFEFLEV